MRKVEEVALYAVLLREAARNHHTCAQSLLDDFECCRDQVNFALMLAHQHFTELDWQMVDLLINYPGEVAEAARMLYGEHEQPLEAEALLHAVLPNGKKSRAQWFDPFRERWEQVRASMLAWEREDNLTTSLGDVKQIAKNVFMTARPHCTLDDYYLLFERELGEPVESQEWERARKNSNMYPGDDVDPLTAFVRAQAPYAG